MGMEHLVIHALRELPKAYREGIDASGAQEIEDILNVHAIGAAATGLATGWIPGAGGTAALMASVGFIWSMYYRINKRMHISVSKTIVKSLASAVLTNLAGTALTLVGGTVLATALSFTGLGNVVSSLIMGAMEYAVVLVSGIIYLKLLVNLFKAGKDPSAMDAEELKAAVTKVIHEENVDQMLKDAKKDYTEAYKAGKVTGKETIDLEDE